MSAAWPHPADTAVDRARSIARSCFEALRDVAPQRAATYQAAACELGETWLVPASELEAPDGLVSASELGARMGVSRSTVWNWAQRGLGPGARTGDGVKLTRYPGGYDPVEAAQLLAWAREQRADPTGPSS